MKMMSVVFWDVVLNAKQAVGQHRREEGNILL